VPGATVWSLTPGAGDGQTRVLPDGCMDVVRIGGRLLVAGPDTRAHITTIDGPGGPVIGIRFHPGVGPSVLGLPADRVRDERIGLDDVWPAALVRGLSQRVADDARPAATLERALLDMIARRRGSRPPHPLAPAAVRAVVAVLAFTGRVDDAADAAGIGPRQLHRAALAAFGYGPKTLARVLRMQRALALARNGTALADVAAECGYSDQPHLSREVTALAGASIRQVLRQR